MSKKDIQAIVIEAFKTALSQASEVDEAFGYFRRRDRQAEPGTGPLSANSWDMKARHHRQMTVKHTELAHDFDQMGNREAGDYHTAAADAHSKAAKALHYHNEDPGSYHRAAAAADSASRKASVFVNEETSPLNEISKEKLRSYILKANQDKAKASEILQHQAHQISLKDDRTDKEKKRGEKAAVRYGKRNAGTMLAMRKFKEKDQVRESHGNLNEISYTDENGDVMHYYGDDIGRAFKHAAEKYKSRETGTVNHRSAPDSSKFIAPAHGMIQHLQNVQVAREHPFQPHRFDHFIKIGSNVDRDTAEAIKSDIHDYLMDTGHTSVDYKGNPTGELGNYSKDYIRTVDKHGNPYTLKTVHGTAWGGIGIVKGHDR